MTKQEIRNAIEALGIDAADQIARAFEREQENTQRAENYAERIQNRYSFLTWLNNKSFEISATLAVVGFIGFLSFLVVNDNREWADLTSRCDRGDRDACAYIVDKNKSDDTLGYQARRAASKLKQIDSKP